METLWFVTFLLTEDAKDLGRGVEDEAEWGEDTCPARPALVLQCVDTRTPAGPFVVSLQHTVRTLVANFIFW